MPKVDNLTMNILIELIVEIEKTSLTKLKVQKREFGRTPWVEEKYLVVYPKVSECIQKCLKRRMR